MVGNWGGIGTGNGVGVMKGEGDAPGNGSWWSGTFFSRHKGNLR